LSRARRNRGRVQELWSSGNERSRFIGEVAPFFLKRVLNLEHDLAPSGHPMKRLLRRIGFFSKSFQKVYENPSLSRSRFAASACLFRTKLLFRTRRSEGSIQNYRSNSYNRERIRYEPEYADLAGQVAVALRRFNPVKLAHSVVTGNSTSKAIFRCLTMAEADGKFLP